MNLEFCNNKCPIGKAAREDFLRSNNSAFDAAIDFWHFTDNCFKTCKYKEAHKEAGNK